MEQQKAMEYCSRNASSDVLKPRNMYIRMTVPIELEAAWAAEPVWT
jgi:hypothetical protein